MMRCNCLLLLAVVGVCESFSIGTSSSTSSTCRSDIGNDGHQRALTTGYSRRAFFHASASILATTAISSPSYAALTSPLILESPAPEFSLMNSRGQIVTLDTLAESGKWTVLYFYPGAFTSGCTLEARKFQEDISAFQKLNAQIVGVSVDNLEKNAEFCRAEGLDFYMLTDEGGKISKAYGTSLSIPGFGTFSNRQTYIIDPQKNMRWVFTDVESHIPRHSAEVLEKLKELQEA